MLVYACCKKNAVVSPTRIIIIKMISKAVNIIIIIIITRPKPAYGRQSLVGLLGQDTDQAGTFWGVLNHEKLTWNLETPLKIDLKP